MTITPGTIAIESTGEEFLVHGLTRAGAEGCVDSDMDRRVRRLEETGVIRRYVALLDPIVLDLGLLAYVNVKLEKRRQDERGRFAFDSFRDDVQRWPEVVACYAMTGDIDYLMRVQARDLDDFSRFVLEKLLKHPAVLDVRSSFALDRIKETTVLPLRRP